MCKMLQKMLGYFLLSQLGLLLQDMKDAGLPIYQMLFFTMLIGMPAIYMIEDAIVQQYGLFNERFVRAYLGNPDDEDLIVVQNQL